MDWIETKINRSENSVESDDGDIYADPMMRLDLLEAINYDDTVSIEIETGSDGMSEEDENSLSEQEMCIVFICGNKTSVPHQVGFHR